MTYNLKGKRMINNNQSEVSRLEAEIELENAACRYALNAPSLGVARHSFITSKMERIGELHEDLKTRIGEEKTARFIVRTMNHGDSK
jgi:hypothetical protein